MASVLADVLLSRKWSAQKFSRFSGFLVDIRRKNLYPRQRLRVCVRLCWILKPLTVLDGCGYEEATQKVSVFRGKRRSRGKNPVRNNCCRRNGVGVQSVGCRDLWLPGDTSLILMDARSPFLEVDVFHSCFSTLILLLFAHPHIDTRWMFWIIALSPFLLSALHLLS